MPILLFLSLVMCFFGTPAVARDIDFDSADIQIQGVESGDFVGQVNSALSDDTFLVGAGEGATQVGSLLVFQNLSLDDGVVTRSAAVTSINGTTINDFVGKFMSAGGDLDGDLVGDLVVGVPNKGQIQVYLGKDIGSWDSAASTVFRSDFLNNASGTHLPQFLSLAGDVNGDGFDDLLVGANIDDSGGNPNGSAFLMLGRSDIDDVSLLDMVLDESDEVSIHFVGEESGDNTGYSVDIISDVNGDGFDDILIGGFRHNGTPSGFGTKVHLIYGRADFSDVLTSTNNFDLNDADAVFFSKDSGLDGFGETVKGLGDINGDGFGDFAISAPKDSNAKGKVYVYYGGEGTPFSGRYDSSSVYSASIAGEVNNNEFGVHAVASLGDSNGDLIHDLIFGEFWSSQFGTNAGAAFIVYGGSGGTSLTGDSDISELEDVTFYSDNTNAQIGFSVGSAGDIDQDGINDVFIGTKAYDSTVGAVGIFSLYQNVTPSFTTEEIAFFTDDSYTTEKTTFSNLDFVYVEVEGPDPDAASINVIEITVSSVRVEDAITLRLSDSPFHSGDYRGYFQLVRTRSKPFARQVGADLSDDVTVRLVHADAVEVFSVSNAIPEVVTINAVQISTGNDTEVVVEYQAIDGDEEMLSFEQSSVQVQYSEDGTTWVDASITGTTELASASVRGVWHTESSQPLIWQAGVDLGVVDDEYQVRIRPHDGTGFASYYVTADIHVDNQAPDAPVVSALGVKHATSITVTGSAEANTVVHVFVDDEFAASADVGSDGLFSVFPVSVSESDDEVYVRVRDAVGFWSPSSNVVSLSFSDLSRTFTDSGIVVELDIPLGSVTNDGQVLFSLTPTPSVSEDAPYEKRYLHVFDLSIDDGQDVTEFQESVTVTFNFDVSLTVNDGVTVMFYDEMISTWSSEGITVDVVTSELVGFRTSHFSQFAVVQNLDPYPPVIGQFQEGGRYLATDHFYDGRPDFSVIAQDEDSGIVSWSITLSLVDGDDVAFVSSSNLSETDAIVLEMGELESDLADGQYQIVARVWDGTDNTATQSDTFYVNQTTFRFSMVAGPNPYDPSKGELSIGYTLSLDAEDLVIYIVNLRGHLMHRLNLEDGDLQAGYHIAQWNGRDNNSNTVPNGVYYMYVIATRDGETIKQKFKLAVLR